MIRAAVVYALRAFRARRRRWAGFVVVVAIGLAVVSATAGIAGRAGKAADTSAQRDGAGRVVDVEIVDAVTGTSRRLTTDVVQRVKEIRGVERVLPSVSAALGLKTETVPGVLLRTATVGTSRPPMVRPSGAPPALRRGDVLLPARAQGSDLRSMVGRRLTFESQHATGIGQGRGADYTLRVVGTYEPSFQVDGPDTAYVSGGDAAALAARANGMSVHRFRSLVGFDEAEVVVRQEADVPRVLREVQALRLPASTLAQRYAELPAVLEVARTLGRILGLLLAVLVGVTAAAQTAAGVRARWAELGVLRAVGFGRRHAVVAFGGEAVLALTAGLLLGLLLAVPFGAAFVSLIGPAGRSVAGGNLSSWPDVGTVAAATAVLMLAGALGAGIASLRAARMNPSLLLRGG